MRTPAGRRRGRVRGGVPVLSPDGDTVHNAAGGGQREGQHQRRCPSSAPQGPASAPSCQGPSVVAGPGALLPAGGPAASGKRGPAGLGQQSSGSRTPSVHARRARPGEPRERAPRRGASVHAPPLQSPGCPAAGSDLPPDGRDAPERTGRCRSSPVPGAWHHDAAAAGAVLGNRHLRRPGLNVFSLRGH